MSPATDWKEIVPEGEPAALEKLGEQLREMQRKQARGGKALRGLHAKGNAGLEAEFTVLGDLPEHARVGLFAKPATYGAYVRYSNGAGAKQPDSKPDVRGIAIKVVGVEGRKIIPGLENAKTQDFLMIRTPSQPFRNAEDFIWFVRAAATPALLVPKVLGHFGPVGGFKLLKTVIKGLAMPITSLATIPYFSALPVKFGPHAIRYSIAPKATEAAGAKAAKSAEHLADELATRLAQGPVVFDFRVQFFRDEATTPIEDASKDWSETDSPYVTVARLTIKQQDPRSARGQKVTALVEGMSFDPWHTTEDFRPLGNMMRARNAAYRLSTQERAASSEPDGSERFE